MVLVTLLHQNESKRLGKPANLLEHPFDRDVLPLEEQAGHIGKVLEKKKFSRKFFEGASI